MEKEIKIVGKRIRVYFPYSEKLVDVARQLPDRGFQKNEKSPSYWHMPVTIWHLRKAIESFPDFKVHKSAQKLLDDNQERKWKGEIKLRNDELKLMDFQKEGVLFTWRHRGRAIIGDDMGLGKTIQALAYLYVIRREITRVLIVSPASVVYKWEAEVHKWLGWNTQVVQTGKDPIQKVDVTILSYALMRTKFRELKNQYDVLIFDEAHKLKNYKSQQSLAARQIISGNRRVLLLTGTPFKNRPNELFNLLNLVRPDLFPDFFPYAIRYCGAQQTSLGWDFSGSSNEEELRDRLNDVMIRRLKVDVLQELPDITRALVPVDITNLRTYRREKAELLAKPGATALTTLTALRQIVGKGKSHPGLQWAQEFLEDNPDEKLVVFAHHQSVVEHLELGLASYGAVKIVGSVSQPDRQKAVKAFQESPFVRVMILSSAGGEGIDLWAASNILFVERMWTPADEEQIEARLHRIGQKNAVTAWYLVARDTMDERMQEIVDSKRQVFADILTAPDVLTEILEEVYELLKGGV